MWPQTLNLQFPRSQLKHSLLKLIALSLCSGLRPPVSWGRTFPPSNRIQMTKIAQGGYAKIHRQNLSLPFQSSTLDICISYMTILVL